MALLQLSPPAGIANGLLDSLPPRERKRLIALCEPVELECGQILANPGDAVTHVHFPTTSFVSMVTPMGGKDTLEVALAGNEGMFGVSVALRASTSNVRGVVQGAGTAWRMNALSFQRELAASPALSQSVLRYVHVLMAQLSQTVGCNRFHVVEQRLARWLLMTSDRSHSRTFHVTHELLALLLGVRRVTITNAATSLQERKLIAYSYGQVTILDRVGLTKASCLCYQADLDRYRRAFAGDMSYQSTKFWSGQEPDRADDEFSRVGESRACGP